MATYTLLEVVQKVLIALNSDKVDSISDTREAIDVANIVEDEFYNIVTNQNIYTHKELIQAVALADTDKPTYMRIPTNVKNIEIVKYNCADPAVTGEVDYRDMVWLYPDQFLLVVNARDATDTATYKTVTDDSGVKLIIDKTEYPTYFTSFDDYTLIFDAYKATDESTLQQSKTLIYGQKVPSFTLEDDHAIDLPDALFPLLIEEVKSTAFVQLRQTSNPKAEQRARQQKVRVQNDRERITRSNRVPDYGRK